MVLSYYLEEREEKIVADMIEELVKYAANEALDPL